MSLVSVLKNERWLNVERDITLQFVFQVCLRKHNPDGYKMYQLAKSFVPPLGVACGGLGRLLRHNIERECWFSVIEKRGNDWCPDDFDSRFGPFQNEDAGGEREITEVISLTVMLPGDTEPNIVLGHLLELRRQLARVRACLATLPRGSGISFGVSLGSSSSSSSSHSSEEIVSPIMVEEVMNEVKVLARFRFFLEGVDDAEVLVGSEHILEEVDGKELEVSPGFRPWRRLGTTSSFIGGKKRKKSLMEVLEGEGVPVEKRRKAHTVGGGGLLFSPFFEMGSPVMRAPKSANEDTKVQSFFDKA
ncbi:hypothetical protein V6N12_013521 [Hibiscus sabdariffa]|uniref:Uncharacterized protein n=1 Tax=Hibiscus sabdariffa TaxID=183260 RepID=A0ABR2C9L4_9ROSI